MRDIEVTKSQVLGCFLGQAAYFYSIEYPVIKKYTFDTLFLKQKFEGREADVNSVLFLTIMLHAFVWWRWRHEALEHSKRPKVQENCYPHTQKSSCPGLVAG